MFSEELSGRLFVNGGVAEFEDDVFGTRNFQTVGLLGGLTFDNRDNPADATRGLSTSTVRSSRSTSSSTAISPPALSAKARAYYGFGVDKDRWSPPGGSRSAASSARRSSEIPPDKLFFAGGGGSVRGYGYRTIGVPVG